jgi:hypothetical protein
MSRHVDTETWIKLETSRPKGDNLTARHACPEVTDRLLAAIDAAGVRHLLIVLVADDKPFRDLQSRGVSVDTKELSIEGKETDRYLDLVCHDSSGHSAFDLVGGDLAEGLRRGTSTPGDLVHQVLSKWRRFWGQTPRQLLTRDEQVGLFGELWFLLMWLASRVSLPEAVNRWRGPFGARHDFESLGLSVEVKATTSTRGRIHRINGIDQLAPPEAGRLLLFSVVLREEAGAGLSLPTLVANCRERLKGEDETLVIFDDALGKTGYSPAHEEEYAKLHVRIVEEGLFRVEGRFPRLTRELFASGIPDGVGVVEYEIDLAGLGDLCIARSASEFEAA